MPGPESGVVGIGDSTPADVTRLGQAISDTQSVLAMLKANGENLSNPKVWDGEYAVTFRNGWKQVSGSFDTLIAELTDLSGDIQQITAAIQRAGGPH